MRSQQRSRATFAVPSGGLPILKAKMLNWCTRFGIFLYLDSNEYRMPHGRYEVLLGCGSVNDFSTGDGGAGFSVLQDNWEEGQDWLFGHLSYDLKNGIEKSLHSSKPAQHCFDELHFFRPTIVCGMLSGEEEVFIETYLYSPDWVWQQIQQCPAADDTALPRLALQRRESKAAYLAAVGALKEHIRNGDCYEVNYCCEAFAEGVKLDAPTAVFQKLNALSPAPFAACYRQRQAWLFCTSPERFLQRHFSRLISQPIKGTARRGADPEADKAIMAALRNSEKERAENVMIVDLVRNDLARSCEVGSVKVDELFGIHSYPQVHQMVSTISGTLREDMAFSQAIKAAFPMGSMTGAPKVKVMELIERYEGSRRGLYSGAVGYVSPSGDFDFNVVIRSLQYNSATCYLSYHTGGAITWDSDPEAEWEEMLLKGWAMEKIFDAKI